jgi:hypothetical protein
VANHCGRPILLVSADDDKFPESGLFLPLLHAHTNWFSKRLLVVGWQARAHNHYVGVVPIKLGVDASQMVVDEAVKLTRECLPNAEDGTVLVRGLANAGGAADFGPLPGAEAEARLQECFGETWQGGAGFLEVGGEHEKDLSRLLPVRVCVDSGYGGLVRRDTTAAAQG